MKIRTQDLTGPALDWAVAKAEDNEDCRDPYVTRTRDGVETYVKVTTFSGYEADWEPSADWSQAGPIIEREKISVETWNEDIPGLEWAASIESTCNQYGESDRKHKHGPTPLIAAMRCFVASKLGDEVDVPKELS